MRAVKFRDLHAALRREAQISDNARAYSAYQHAARMLLGTLGEPPEGFDVAVVLTPDGRVDGWLSNMGDAISFSTSGYVVIALRSGDGWDRDAAQRTFDSNRRQYRAERGYLGEDDV